jgi:predicted acyltransferase
MNPNKTLVAPALETPAAGRLLSLDALRGFDMFWIIGADVLIQALRGLSDAPVIRLLASQVDHKPWDGFAFYDLIFPLFVFIVGVSLVFSLTKTIDREGRPAACWRIARRTILLYVLGIICYGGFSTPFHEIRLLGVLQRIALCYGLTGLAFCFLKTRGRIILGVGLLVGYWAVMTFVPVPGVGAGDFTEGKNLANYIDQQYLPGRKWDGDHDSEGLLSTLPAVATCLMGVLAGQWLANRRVDDRRKVLFLLGAGVASLALGWLWHLQFPVIKKIWTSSYVLVSGGYSCLLLAAFYQVIEVWKFSKWAMPFVWIGMNPITIYMAHHLVDFPAVAKRFVGGDVNLWFGRGGQLVIASVALALSIWFCQFLYQRKIFLRV